MDSPYIAAALSAHEADSLDTALSQALTDRSKKSPKFATSEKKTFKAEKASHDFKAEKAPRISSAEMASVYANMSANEVRRLAYQMLDYAGASKKEVALLKELEKLSDKLSILKEMEIVLPPGESKAGVIMAIRETEAKVKTRQRRLDDLRRGD